MMLEQSWTAKKTEWKTSERACLSRIYWDKHSEWEVQYIHEKSLNQLRGGELV